MKDLDKLLDNVNRPYTMLQILQQIVHQNKLAKIESHQEISKIGEILDNCEQQAYPKIIKDTFMDYKQQLVSNLSM